VQTQLPKPAVKPAATPADETASDYQLSRALEMLKGLDVFSTMAKGKAAALKAAPTGASSE
jgi:hypothetical protein